MRDNQRAIGHSFHLARNPARGYRSIVRLFPAVHCWSSNNLEDTKDTLASAFICKMSDYRSGFPRSSSL